ncbi:intermembrane transport protein PqiB [Sodalis sp. C49]|uniref:PqiB family protein n=1 Tax=Sodalis sp. C49 TaxID=3228929 RepID=UPI0039659BBC
MTPLQHPPAVPGEPALGHRRRMPSPIWLIPLIALLTGGAMLIETGLSSGPEIAIAFQSAAGLEAGKTAVKYKDVTVGIVKSITLSEDSSRVQVTVLLNKSAANLARADTRFWVVRPRIGIGGVTGIDTLLSGAFIGVDKGESTEWSSTFTGLEVPPAIINGMPGSRFVVLTDDLGSLDIGSPVYYRRIQVGRLASYQLNHDGQSVGLQVFIDAPYDRFVKPDTRFWNVSGLDLSVGADGFRMRTQSIVAMMAGGIAFATPTPDATKPSPARVREYWLSRDQDTAMAPPDGPAITFKLRFERSLHGLTVGAPVEFSSVKVGRVVSVELDYNQTGYRFPSLVRIEVYPSRLGNVLNKLPKTNKEFTQATAEFARGLVAQGLRAQAVSSSLLSGQLYISLDFVPNAAKVPFDLYARPLVLPTYNGGFNQLQEQVASIVNKIDHMPLESIGYNLNATLDSANQTLRQVNGQTLPDVQRLLRQLQQTAGTAQDLLSEDSPLVITLGQSLQELLRTLRALHSFTDQIDRHPESLLQGRPADPRRPKTGSKHASTQDASR